MVVVSGRRAVVTGGAAGVGLATARLLATSGAQVVIADRDRERGEAAARDIGARWVEADVSEPDRIAAALQEAARMLGGIDVLHLNAGVSSEDPDVSRLEVAAYRRLMALDVDQVVFGVREATRLMVDGGDVVVTAGKVGLAPYSPDPIYAMAKHAVVGFVRSAAPSLGRRRITVNAICPGAVRTPLMGDAGATFFKASGVTVLEPVDVAVAVVHAIDDGRSGECWIPRPGRSPARLGHEVTVLDVEAEIAGMAGEIERFMDETSTTESDSP
jgi:NAD(P)-dependent dehydrogenase (short-subunit alcohol dehydrogenase family)